MQIIYALIFALFIGRILIPFIINIFYFNYINFYKKRKEFNINRWINSWLYDNKIKVLNDHTESWNICDLPYKIYLTNQSYVDNVKFTNDFNKWKHIPAFIPDLSKKYFTYTINLRKYTRCLKKCIRFKLCNPYHQLVILNNNKQILKDDFLNGIKKEIGLDMKQIYVKDKSNELHIYIIITTKYNIIKRWLYNVIDKNPWFVFKLNWLRPWKRYEAIYIMSLMLGWEK